MSWHQLLLRAEGEPLGEPRLQAECGSDVLLIAAAARQHHVLERYGLNRRVLYWRMPPVGGSSSHFRSFSPVGGVIAFWMITSWSMMPCRSPAIALSGEPPLRHHRAPAHERRQELLHHRIAPTGQRR